MVRNATLHNDGGKINTAATSPLTYIHSTDSTLYGTGIARAASPSLILQCAPMVELVTPVSQLTQGQNSHKGKGAAVVFSSVAGARECES